MKQVAPRVPLTNCFFTFCRGKALEVRVEPNDLLVLGIKPCDHSRRQPERVCPLAILRCPDFFAGIKQREKLFLCLACNPMALQRLAYHAPVAHLDADIFSSKPKKGEELDQDSYRLKIQFIRVYALAPNNIYVPL